MSTMQPYDVFFAGGFFRRVPARSPEHAARMVVSILRQLRPETPVSVFPPTRRDPDKPLFARTAGELR